MKRTTLISGLKEEDLMTLRWNANINTVGKKTGEYKILNNKGVYLGELWKEADGYKIMFDRDWINASELGELLEIKKIAEGIINKKIKSPIVNTKKVIPISRYLENYLYKKPIFLSEYAA
jgi:hypothetical protein